LIDQNLDNDMLANVNYSLVSLGNDPQTINEAKCSEHWSQWEQALQTEMNSLKENNTWILTELPNGRKAIKCKWVFKVKYDSNGNIERYKCRLVAKGFSQVQTAFLNGDLKEEIYMEQPSGFADKDRPNHVCKLLGTLYGLKQSLREWNKKLDEFLKTLDFNQCLSDYAIYIHQTKDVSIIIAVYVDDLVIFGTNKIAVSQLKQKLTKRFKIRDLGNLNYILGVKVSRDRVKRTITISQEKYITDILKRFKMLDSLPADTPSVTNNKLQKREKPTSFDAAYEAETQEMKSIPYAEAVGSLIYAMVVTRFDISYSVGLVSRFMSEPSPDHWKAVKRIFRYLNESKLYSITFGGADVLELQGYTDSSHAYNQDTMRSTGGYVMMLNEAAISWNSKRQQTVALSSTEAEYMAMSIAISEIVLIRSLFDEHKFHSVV
jgi:hypothetical protein